MSRSERPNRYDRPPEPHDWRWVVGWIGRTLITIGLLLFAFVGYQLWGTGIQTAQAQNRLSSAFEEQLAQAATSTTTTVTTTETSGLPTTTSPTPTSTPPSTTTTQPLPMIGRPTLGDPIARLDIPAIGMDGTIVIEGVRPTDLQDGPGHFPETPLPGQFGNAAIAGHRTTHGQPFFHIDELAVGDQIIVTTLAGRYVYLVTGQEIVGPSDYDAVIPTLDPSVATLTLTSCHPRFTSKQRIVIHAEIDLANSDLVTAPFGAVEDLTGSSPDTPEQVNTIPGDDVTTTGAPATTVPDTAPTPASSTLPAVGATVAPPTTDSSLGADAGAEAFANRWFSDRSAFLPVALWGAVLVGIAVGIAAIGRRTRRLWLGVLVGCVPFVVTLYFWFENVNRLLPPNL